MDSEKYYTRFERARIIGTRALQISAGAPILVETSEEDPIRIAAAEFDAGTIPLDVRGKSPPKKSQ